MAREATRPEFVHLHVHTEYSLLDGACRIRELVERCRELEMPAVAVTDHGNLFGAIDFYTAAVAAGVQPIIGCEVYVAPGDRREREMRGLGEASYHLLLLARDLTGYRNLIKLASIGYLEGFYYKPRIDKEVLRAHAAGLIATSACLGGEIPHALRTQGPAAARAVAEQYLAIFGPDRFYLEIQNQNLPEQRALNAELAGLARRLGVGLLATNDVHYLGREDVEAHDVLCCIATRARVRDEQRFRFESDQYYLKSPAEMAAALAEYPEALANTRHVAGQCALELDFTRRYAPQFRPPDGRSPDEYLRERVYAGARVRYGALTEELRERIDYELEVIRQKGFSSYFLIVWDFVEFARRQRIPAVARGSGCSTVVGYCLGISAVDPLHYGLYFERFMDPERDEMPDMDIDICQDRRPEVINYVREKYGHVAQIITFGRLKARAAIRDICRALDVPLAEADRVARLVPEELKMTIDKALEREPELRERYRRDATIRKVLDIGRRLEGLARHASVHAAGVVIADVPLDTLVPLYKPADAKEITTQFEGPTVEKVGLLKMDFLGLKTLSQIQRTCELVERHHGVALDLERLDLADPQVYALLARGETKGIFQFESGGMRDVLMKMKPNRIEDLIAANALFRPGPMEYIDEYIARKHGRRSWETPHPVMTEVLAETYGIMVYQEQVSRLVHRLGGVPLRRAFRLAKAISKKKTAMIDAEREPFLEGAVRNGVPRRTAARIFEDILKFGGYAFNKAHSTGYALVAFKTAWLKTYYPLEFMAALLTYESGSTEKVAEYIEECRRMGIPVRPPNINESDEAFTVVYEGAGTSSGQGVEGEGSRLERSGAAGSEERGAGRPREASGGPAPLSPRPPGPSAPAPRGPAGHICFGLAAINGVGHKAVQAILAARREGGRFRDIYDLCQRVDLTGVNKAVLEALIKAGALDCTGAMRRALMEVLEQALELGQEAQRDRRAGQLQMFGDFAAGAVRPPPIGTAEWPDSEMLAYEKATLGFYITKHPLAQYADLVQRFSTTDTAGLARLPDRQRIVLGGLVARVRAVPIRSGRSAGKKMLVATIEDFAGATEALVFPDQLEAVRPVLRPDAIVFIEGEVDRRREEPSIRTGRVIPIERARREFVRTVLIRIGSDGGPLAALADLRDLCRRHPGPCAVYLEVESPAGWVAAVKAREPASVDPSDEFLGSVARLPGVRQLVCGGPGGPVVVR